MTQEEMLLEAAQTGASHGTLLILLLFIQFQGRAFQLVSLQCNHLAEIMNLRNLEKVLAREEEVKKRAIVHKSVYSGPQIRYLSKDGKPSLFLLDFRLILVLILLFYFSLSWKICEEKSIYFVAGLSYLTFMNGSSFESQVKTISTPCK